MYEIKLIPKKLERPTGQIKHITHDDEVFRQTS